MNRTDAELVLAYVKRGDHRAFGLLVERHKERIFGYLLGMVRDRSLADDLFQETFIRAIRAMTNERGTYDPQGKWLQWVMRIARNAALDHIRSQKRRKTISVGTGDDADDLDMSQLAVDVDPIADMSIVTTERRDFLYACIDQLPPEQREVLLMRHESELTFREISELTDCSINTALGRMRYALLNLRRMMVETDVKELERIELAS